MAKIKVGSFSIGHPNDGNYKHFKVDINCSSDGIFFATLPEEISKDLLSVGVKLTQNPRTYNDGYFEAKEIYVLESLIKRTLELYSAKKEINRELKIVYQIDIMCSYGKDEGGNFIPNLGHHWSPMEGSRWISGTREINMSRKSPFGIRVYAQLFHCITYLYPSGEEKKVYTLAKTSDFTSDISTEEFIQKSPNLAFLLETCSIDPITSREYKPGKEWMPSGEYHEVLYTEERAQIFVSMLKGIYKINESIKQFIHPETIDLLGNPEKLLLLNG